MPIDSAIIHPVIMCGGSGTRLWPLSRLHFPKQFLPLVGDETMLQQTARRFRGAAFAPPAFICGEDHRFTVADQAAGIGLLHPTIILERTARGTAPAAALAALTLLRDAAADEDPLLLLAPADHAIADAAALTSSIAAAVAAARAGYLVTFGILPAHPETGYGYIHLGPPIADAAPAHIVDRFVEKPPLATAQAYLADGHYLWNSGIFLFSARSYLRELERQAPAIIAACHDAVAAGRMDIDFFRPDADRFAACPEGSIDRTVMERTDKAAVLPISAGWNDVGSWSALWDIGTKDGEGNVMLGPVFGRDNSGSYLRSEGPLLGVLGVTDVAVVATEDAVLIMPRDRAQEAGKLVEQLRNSGHPAADQHRKVHRPWGYFHSVDSGDRYQVKQIVVKPGAALSLQMHHHRAEHWVVVSGTAKVTRGDDVFLLKENESTFIPLGMKHRLENPGEEPLSIIEIQSGNYLGEDDIVRFEDKFGRV